MHTYLEKWFTVIEKMRNDNTYKLAWGRALIECIVFKQYTVDDENTLIIEFDDISKCMIKYYWNQTFFFNLKQAPYKNKKVGIRECSVILIEEYKRITSSTIPVWYGKGIEEILKYNPKLFNDMVKKVSCKLHENVSHCFLNVGKVKLPLYEYEKSKGSRVYFDYSEAMILNDYAPIIAQLLNYKWAQLLEKYNNAPRIANKVNAIANVEEDKGDQKIRRESLKKYKKILVDQMDGNIVDFYTGEKLTDKEATVDHVIPWSFMYSNDIWNLVLTSQSNNSSKSNSIPSQEIIDKLKERNSELVKGLEGKYKYELELAISNNYVDKFYFESRL